MHYLLYQTLYTDFCEDLQ